MSWALPFRLHLRHEGPELLVGEWTCEGQPVPASREVAHHAGLDLLLHGAHLRSFGRTHTVMSPRVAALPWPGDECEIHSRPGTPQRGTVILLRGALAEELLPRRRAAHCALSPRATLLHVRLVKAVDPTEVVETAVELVAAVAGGLPAEESAPLRAPSRTSRRLAEDIHHVIARGFRSRLTLERIAGECGVSVFQACRAFRAVTGVSIHQQLTQVRLQAALVEMERGALSRVALDVGFSSHSHFSNAFRAAFGVPPGSVVQPRP